MLHITEHLEGHIPYVHFRLEKECTQTPPLLVLYHGWGSSTKNMQFLASTFALWGFHVVTPEIIYHDSRGCLPDHFKKETQEQYFWKTVLHSVDDALSLSRELGKSYNGNVILIGSSMGGMISSGAFVQDSLFKGMVNINGSANWSACEQYFQSVGYQATAYEREIEELNPQRSLSNLNERPVFLLNGSGDVILPAHIQRTFYDGARVSYLDKTRLQFIEYQGVGHTVTLTMIEETVNWLKKHFATEELPHHTFNV